MHALIIEDDYLIGRSLEDALGDLGFTRFSFARSEDAAILAATGGETFDLVTADIRLMPGDGVKAAETIRSGKPIPLVFVTAYPEELRDRLADRLAEVPIVRKPVRAVELNAAVHQVLASSAPRQQ